MNTGASDRVLIDLFADYEHWGFTSKLPHRRRRMTLAAALRQAERAGLKVSGAVWGGDSIELRFGEPAKPETSELDDWIAKNAH